MNTFLGRLMLWQKLAFLGVLACLMALIPLVKYVGTVNEGLRTARLEQQGIPPVRALMRVAHAAQLHRALSGRVLGGDAAAAAPYAANTAAVDAAIARVDELRGALPGGALDRGWAPLQARWNDLRERIETRRIDGGASLAAH